MKAKGQPYSSEVDAKEKLIVYVYEYLIHSGAIDAAKMFKESIGYSKDIKVNEGTGFLLDWWCVFWDLYCAAPDRRINGPEPSNDARAFHDFTRASLSPAHTSPPQQQHHQPPQFLTGQRYPTPGLPRGPPTRMQGPHPQHAPHQGPPPQHGPHPGAPPGFMPANSPRYSQMNQAPMFGMGPDQMGQSPMNRMTPVAGPPPHGPQQHQMSGMPGQGPSQGGGPPRNASQGSSANWQGNVNYSVSSPANPGCYSGPASNQPNQGGAMMMADGMLEVKNSPINGGEPSTPHSEEYVMPGTFNDGPNDQCDSAEILKIKESMQNDTKLFEKDQQSEYQGDFLEAQGKWNQSM